MNEAQDHYKKGLLSSKEITNYYELKKTYKQKIDEIILKIKKYAKNNKENPIKILKEVIELENNLSKTRYGKGKGFQKATINPKKETFEGKTTTTMKEHLEIIKTVIKNFDLIRKPINEKAIKMTNKDVNGNYRSYADKNYKWRLIV